MDRIFRIAINYNSLFGSLAYDPNTKSVSVYFPQEEVSKTVEEFFSQPTEVHLPRGLRDFKVETVQPLSTLEAFKAALTVLYNRTGVKVDWSVTSEKLPQLDFFQ